jgi:hypothetical protein
MKMENKHMELKMFTLQLMLLKAEKRIDKAILLTGRGGP